ncbi:antitoxin Xre/MbcA/ParS toxin-binding domain-containing protein [Thiohalocapsa sp. ML1]|jgi:putative toxin-antitoxin system antitoxin component (TIGR02293 family)|uniref:antitoxin Xre/MbcA/ParS toxin-binding domain-containing protein n=1 Tax=Thiohalocapsa sp. ML1 TaxID=1431688 RepID=UPI0009EA9FCC|nr:antitoxin Xre/MbcA/ParS toxin-binding domain-containing protein [Thiohalocapsa sp. ML1]
MIDSERVAEVMGGPEVLGGPVRSLSALESLVDAGLPKEALRRVVERAISERQERRQILYAIVPEATYKRRQVLSPDASERTERLARVVATAEYVWDDPEQARRFLHEPHPMLEGRSPVRVALTELGARRAEDLLWGLFYGLPA